MMGTRLAWAVICIGVTALAGCSAPPPAGTLGAKPMASGKDDMWHPPRLLGGKGGTKLSLGEEQVPPSPMAHEDLGALLGTIKGKPPWWRDDGGEHQSQNGLQNVRMFAELTADSAGVMGGHGTAKYFFNRIIDAARETYPSQNRYELHFPLEADHFDAKNSLRCTVRFDNDGIKPDDYPRLVAVHYAENIASKMAWIEYDIQKTEGNKTNLRHSHRIIFVPRSPPTNGEPDYYPSATKPTVSTGGNNAYGLPQECVPPPSLKPLSKSGISTTGTAKPATEATKSAKDGFVPFDTESGGGGEM